MLPSLSVWAIIVLAAAAIAGFTGRWFFARLFNYYYSDHIDSFFSKVWRKRRPSEGINGLWYSVYWRYTRSNHVRYYSHVVVVRKRGSMFLATALLGPPKRCVLEGRIDSKGFISGTWMNEDQNVQYHGAFQFRRHAGDDVIAGKWLGWNAENRINSGVWVFCRISDKTDRKAQLEVRQRYGALDDPTKLIYDEQYERKIAQLIEAEKDRDINLSYGEVSTKWVPTTPLHPRQS